MQRERLPGALAVACGGQASKLALMAAEVAPTAANAASLRVVWFRPPFEREARAVIVDVRLLPISPSSAEHARQWLEARPAWDVKPRLSQWLSAAAAQQPARAGL